MITKVKLQYFKKFAEETFILGGDVVLAGPNNSGKTTLLQAVSVWNLALLRCIGEHTESSKAKQRTGVPISRKDFTAIPLREMNLLWSGRDTAYGRTEKPNKKAGEPKVVAISLYGKEQDDTEWNLTVTLRYANKELIYIKLTDENMKPLVDVPKAAIGLKVIHVPPFSGIGAEETGLQMGYQNLLVGQGKPGDILRNLLLEVYKKDQQLRAAYWKSLTSDVKELFGYDLLEPQYAETTDPFIRVEYRDPSSETRKSFDVASAGSGFHQVLTLLGFFYARPASILLLDEPDAHLHVILQRQVYDRLRTVARSRKCQLLVSTHSEIILEDTGPEQILSFYGKPHRIEVDIHREQIREALKRLSSFDILSAESGSNILYLEDETDFKILEAFSRVLNHPTRSFFDNPFFYAIHGHDVREAKAHFFGLKAIRPEIKGVLLLDGDNRNLPDREIGAENLIILRWRRYEIENYFIHQESLLRFVKGPEPTLFSSTGAKAGEEYLRGELPPAVLADPMGDHDYLLSTAASKTFLPAFFEKSGIKISKKDYYQFVQQMHSSEIHHEIKEKLDTMTDILIIVAANNT